MLINYRVDPEVLARVLPAPFRPKRIKDFGMAGICLIRLEGIRPLGVPLPFGLSSENAAHRVAVEWDDAGSVREGVFVRRRDSSSRLNAIVGGRLFPGIHHHAAFNVLDADGRIHVEMVSDDDDVRVKVEAEAPGELPRSSVFSSVPEASRFFEGGSLGYSPGRLPGTLDGLELRTDRWALEPLRVRQVSSSVFEDRHQFPLGSVEFDCGLLMREIPHEWHARGSLTGAPSEGLKLEP
ncbi:MAG TPA: DUF2071 domain-containing protein [Vicinamibacteria bacterium]|nr:DUF2071 domain-containing protein [Vicinamibacteria bacterium]